ncbi:hypothetical protein NQ318_018505 [Aromia moschata]|uniref:Uncharacterized protein n=1 Tax=Aromia moschata TaxID=1265417 RepID=A0AAV8X1U2_9CUCU|nr:hypothetical protein NQ318_018505 [Aromia moschata]
MIDDKDRIANQDLILTSTREVAEDMRVRIKKNNKFELANILLEHSTFLHKTHLLENLRSNRRGNPKEVTQNKLKRVRSLREKMHGEYVY